MSDLDNSYLKGAIPNATDFTIPPSQALDQIIDKLKKENKALEREIKEKEEELNRCTGDVAVHYDA